MSERPSHLRTIVQHFVSNGLRNHVQWLDGIHVGVGVATYALPFVSAPLLLVALASDWSRVLWLSRLLIVAVLGMWGLVAVAYVTSLWVSATQAINRSALAAFALPIVCLVPLAPQIYWFLVERPLLLAEYRSAVVRRLARATLVPRGLPVRVA